MTQHRRREIVGIVGLGYVGLPLAVAFADAGVDVIGIDTDRHKLSILEAGRSYVEDVSPERVKELLPDDRLRLSHEYSALTEADYVIICLPTPLDEHREPDLSIVEAGIKAISANLKHDALVVLESTTYPGTTRDVILPALERDGRRVGEDFYLAFSPERVDPGNAEYSIRNTPKVVGGLTPACSEKARQLYESIVDNVHLVSSPESAELSKLLENIFRGVNIALVNELAVLCHRMGIDVWEVIDAAKTKPFGFMPFYPGPGLGGHCIPIDPFYLSWRARAFDMTTEFIELAGRVNVNMPYYAVSRIASVLNSREKPVRGSRILVLGASYKPNVGDIRDSPSLKILDILASEGADLAYHDPHVPKLPQHNLASVELTAKELESADCVVLATDHEKVDLDLVVEFADRVLDLRNAISRKTSGDHSDKVVKL